jgi:predicted porin
MKNTLLGLGIAFASTGAFAQSSGSSSVEVYGAFDIGVGHSQYALSNDSNFAVGIGPVVTHYATQAVTGMFNGGLGGSNFGIKGAEDLGSGWKAIFKLESGINAFDGTLSNGVASVANNLAGAKQVTSNGDSSLAGQLFNREATVGLSSSQYGTFTFGRNNTLGYDALIAYDVMGGSYVFSPFGYSGSYGGGGFTEDYRIDNSVKYRYRADNGLNFGALYKFGGQAGSSSAQSEWQFTLGYTNGPLSVQGLYSSVHDGISATNSSTLGDIAITVADTTAYMLSASYQFDQLKVSGGYERMDFNNPSNPVLDASIGNVFGYTVSGTPNTTAYTIEKQLDVYFAGLSYAFTPTTTGAIAYYDVHQNDYSGGACSASDTVSSKCAGNNKFWSLMGTYKFSKRTTVYAGYLYSEVDGGYSSGFVHDNNNFFGTGIRHTF